MHEESALQPLGGPQGFFSLHKDLTPSSHLHPTSHLLLASPTRGTPSHRLGDLCPQFETPRRGRGDRLELDFSSLVLAGSRSPAIATSPIMDLAW